MPCPTWCFFKKTFTSLSTTGAWIETEPLRDRFAGWVGVGAGAGRFVDCVAGFGGGGGALLGGGGGGGGFLFGGGGGGGFCLLLRPGG